MNDIIQQPASAPSAIYTITAAQFVTDGYAAKIAAGECRVYHKKFDIGDIPASSSERAAYAYLLRTGGNLDEIGDVELVSERYAYLKTADRLRTLGVGHDHSLIVVPNGVPWQIAPNL